MQTGVKFLLFLCRFCWDVCVTRGNSNYVCENFISEGDLEGLSEVVKGNAVFCFFVFKVFGELWHFSQIPQLIPESFEIIKKKIKKTNKQKNLKVLLQSWTNQGGKILPGFVVPRPLELPGPNILTWLAKLSQDVVG